ncbi:hypothetical protein GCM10009839_65510 [Catenulispora yoronensis]|uniref:DUF1269 domain-containing family protein n=1 Tax=Catenulispora yoronensis TaxID=450799 RepID=A0ABP5GRS7_9ACTN
MPSGLTADTVGPVDVAVFAFDGNRFNGDVAPALADLQRAGTIRILDATLVLKDAAGEISVLEIADSAIADSFEHLTGQEFDLLSDEDVTMVAEGLDRDSSALVIAWEHTWAARVSGAIRDSGGSVMFMERVPRENVIRAIKALDQG